MTMAMQLIVYKGDKQTILTCFFLKLHHSHQEKSDGIKCDRAGLKYVQKW